MFNPRTGQLFLKIIHISSVWAEQKRFGQVSVYALCHVIIVAMVADKMEES